MPYLPGNTAQRIAELRSQRGLTQEQLSDAIACAGLGHYARSTISRVESGEVKNVSSEMIMALARYFDVTADFLLGLTDIPDKKNYELSELGLSYEAARKLLFREVNPDALNRFIECKSFAELCERIACFYHSAMTETYTNVDGLFSGIRNLPVYAEALGYTIPESEQDKLKRDLSVLRNPIEVQKHQAVEQFKMVMDELTDLMYSGIDPKAMIMDNEAFRKAAEKNKREEKIADISEINQANIPDAIFDVVSQMLGIPEEGKESYLQLLKLMNERLNKNGKD